MDRTIANILGPSRVAQLKNVSMKTAVESRLKTAGLLGYGEELNAYTAARALGTQTHYKLAEHRGMLRGIEDLKEVLRSSRGYPVKEASSFLAGAPVLEEIYSSLRPGVKTASETDAFYRVKTALFGSMSLPEVAAAAKKVFHSPLGKGLATGVGVAIPGAAAANYVMDRQTDRVQNKVLKGLGVGAGLLATAYGAHKLLSPGPQNASGVQKLSSHLILDVALGSSTAVDELGTEKVAKIRRLNARDGTRILRKLFT